MKLGDREGLATIAGFRGIIAGRAGDWRMALRAFVDSAELHIELHESLPFWGQLWGVAFAFARLGNLEPAARMMGFLDARFGRMPDNEFEELLGSTDALLLERLSEQDVAELKMQGAALELAEVVGYMRAQTALALGD
jgi:hypothetical protein